MLEALFPGSRLCNIALAVLFAALLFAVGFGVGDRVVGGVPASAPSTSAWPAGVIRYEAALRWSGEADAAAAKWNAVGLNVRFERATPGGRVDLSMRVDVDQLRADGCVDCIGRVKFIGYQEGERAVIWLPPRLEASTDADRVRVVSHELGHVLGLEHHQRGCALMRDDAGVTGCRRLLREDPAALCGPTAADLRQLVARHRDYGAPARGYSPRCEERQRDEWLRPVDELAGRCAGAEACGERAAIRAAR